MAYKWDYPSNWLLSKCQDAAGRGDAAYLLGVINTLIPSIVDSDDIQDSFQSEMDRDGFFNDVPE